MIDTLIFDFGDVFINLDKEGAMKNALEIFNMSSLTSEMIELNKLYEQGLMSTKEFTKGYQSLVPNLSELELKNIWNFIIKDFPDYRLDYVKDLANKTDYQLILLSNTNELHIDYIKKEVPFYDEFKSQFDQFYLSHEIQLRKPEKSIFEFVLDTNSLDPQQCFFIDDTEENTHTAKQMGIHTWTIDPLNEDVIDLFKKFDHLF